MRRSGYVFILAPYNLPGAIIVRRDQHSPPRPPGFKFWNCNVNLKYQNSAYVTWGIVSPSWMPGIFVCPHNLIDLRAQSSLRCPGQLYLRHLPLCFRKWTIGNESRKYSPRKLWTMIYFISATRNLIAKSEVNRCMSEWRTLWSDTILTPNWKEYRATWHFKCFAIETPEK